MQELVGIFKALADETRLGLLSLLFREGELCVCDLEQALEVTQSKASRHLRYLFNAGLVRYRRDGLWVNYRISEELDADRQQILTLLASLLQEERSAALRERLAAWRRRKAIEGPGCPPDGDGPGD